MHRSRYRAAFLIRTEYEINVISEMIKWSLGFWIPEIKQNNSLEDGGI